MLVQPLSFGDAESEDSLFWVRRGREENPSSLISRFFVFLVFLLFTRRPADEIPSVPCESECRVRGVGGGVGPQPHTTDGGEID